MFKRFWNYLTRTKYSRVQEKQGSALITSQLLDKFLEAVSIGRSDAILEEYPQLICNSTVQSLEERLQNPSTQESPDEFFLVEMCVVILKEHLDADSQASSQYNIEVDYCLARLRNMDQESNPVAHIALLSHLLGVADPKLYPDLHYSALIEYTNRLKAETASQTEENDERDSALISQVYQLGINECTSLLERENSYPDENIAEIYHVLGWFYRELPLVGDSTLDLSIDYFEKSLEYLSREKSPLIWANVQWDIGISYQLKIANSQPYFAEKGLEHLENSMGVYDPWTYPEEWSAIADISVNIKNSLDNHSEPNRHSRTDIEIFLENLSNMEPDRKALQFIYQFDIRKHWEIIDRALFRLVLDLREQNEHGKARAMLVKRDLLAACDNIGFRGAMLNFTLRDRAQISQLISELAFLGAEGLRDRLELAREALRSSHIKYFLESLITDSAELFEDDEETENPVQILIALTSRISEAGWDQAIDELLVRLGANETRNSIDNSMAQFLNSSKVRRAGRKLLQAETLVEAKRVLYGYRDSLLSKEIEEYLREKELGFSQNSDRENENFIEFILEIRSLLFLCREVGIESALAMHMKSD